MKRAVLATLAVILLAGFAVAIFGQRFIGERVFASAVDNRVGVDRTADLPDGLHVYVCGSGSPMTDAARAGPCLAVLAGDTGLVFDVGSGSVRKLGAMGFPFDRLDATFLTHLHSDHIDGVGELMLQAWMAGGRSEPLPIHGPPGTDQVVAGFVEAYSIDREFRIAHHGPAVARPSGFGGVARTIDLDALEASDWDGLVYTKGDLSVRVLRVSHAPVDHAFAYRITYKDRSVVISGDTKQHPPLVEFSRDADVIFHEALNPRMVGVLEDTLAQRGQPDAAKIMADIPDYHATPTEAAETAEQAGARALVLYHLVPAPPVRLIEPVFLEDAKGAFSGDLRLAEDGMIVTLPAQGEQIMFDQIL